MSAMGTGEFSALQVAVNNLQLCMNLQAVNKVTPFVWLERLPNSPHYIAGILNLAGRNLPVIDLTLYLNMEKFQHYSLNTPIVICETSKEAFGLIVDEVKGIVVVNRDEIQLDKSMGDKDSLFQGSVSINQQVLLLLNIDKLAMNKLTLPSRSMRDEYDENV